ncbi:MAG TPA: HDOD domain-containing protein [Spirochaetota bacterium]|nr:HDOD domain-containing protein [Spirochaetota bacterium]HOS32858.1 HDOD domain-containing protein [Spirochaetota bacterium]HOS55311.1 HDOD domain-containing protein [Spirochaetota bacterium]HQF76906.1 HDOD domain-containing protein [Spirochaetota bacterium]HQH31474.1 HDOD domain-containing protein [Spirochaetota bacterium]
MKIYRAKSINENVVKSHIDSQEDLILECENFSNEEFEKINLALRLYVESLGKEYIFDYLSYCMKELITNAEKSNSKRIYFDKINLDIKDAEQYSQGMKNFKNDTMVDFEAYGNIQRSKGYYVRIVFEIRNEFFNIHVKNNVEILDEELKTIEERKKMAKEFKTVDEAMSIVLNNPEGSGLGIIISALMLKKLGLNQDSLNFFYDGSDTVASISIPLSLITEEHITAVNELILSEIENIPHFPENILLLQKKLSDPLVNLSEISSLITKDLTLTGDILKYINSAYFMLPKKVSSITEAIKYIGLKGLRNLIYSYGTEKTLSKRFDLTKMQNILDHSYKVAFFSFYLAKKLGLKEELEDVYIAGILHDIGKIVVLGVNPGIMQKINNLCHERGISIRIIEEISSGYNHSAIGALLGKKWNLPENLIETMKNHHTPNNANKKYGNTIKCVYIANAMSTEDDEIEDKYYSLDKTILAEFGLNSLEKFCSQYKIINNEFAKRIKK